VQAAPARHLEPAAKLIEIEDRLGLDEGGAAAHLLFKPDEAHFEGFGAGIGRRTDEKIRRLFEGLAREQAALAHLPHCRDELDRIEVKDPPRFGMVAEALMVAGETENILDAHGRGAEQIALDGDAVTVAAGHLHDRFHPLLQQDPARGNARETDDGGLVVGDVDGVDHPPEAARFFADHRIVTALRRPQLGADDEFPARDFFPQAHGFTSSFGTRHFGGSMRLAKTLSQAEVFSRFQLWIFSTR